MTPTEQKTAAKQFVERWQQAEGADNIVRANALQADWNGVRAFREKSSRAQTKKAAATPEHYGTEIIASSTSILVPKVSSERRRYIPLGSSTPTRSAPTSCS